MPEKHKVIITYSAPLTLLQSDSFQQIHTALNTQLPLRNLHWKSASRASVRTIQELDVDLAPLDSVRDGHTSQVPSSFLARPLLNIYFVICDDADAYRNNIRKQIKEWHSTVSERKNQDWLIVHVERPDARGSSSGFFKVQSSVLDKIKTEFNSDKRDRCIQLVWSPQTHDNPTTWAEVINKIKEGILHAFDSAVTQREEDVKRSEGQRTMPGWNFCTFFILKESLALSFEGVNLNEEALAQYDQLESSFFRVLRERSLSWFGTLISPDPKDETAPLLAIDKKPYRDMILSNTISVFDFRVYLLARQSQLLGKLARVAEVARKCASFIGAFGRRLREVEKDLPRHFVEMWSYASALSVVEQCDVWAAELDLEPAKLNGFNATKAELLEVARKQLDVIGLSLSHLPAVSPFLNSARRPGTASNKENYSSLLASLKDADTFYDLYVAITNRAIDLYAKASRKKVALRLHGDLAALDSHRGRLYTALQTYTSLPAHYQHYRWLTLEAFMLSRGLDTHEQLDKPRDREWILAALSFLRLFAEDVGQEVVTLQQDRKEYTTTLLQSVASAAEQLPTDAILTDHPAFKIKLVEGSARVLGDRDGTSVDITVENCLPCEAHVDEVEIQLHGRDSTRLRFTTPAQTLAPGVNQVTASCTSSIPGTYIFGSAIIRLSKVLFEWTFYKPDKPPKLSKIPPTLVHVPKDLDAFSTLLQQPTKTEVGMQSHVLVVISSGRNHIQRVGIKLSSKSDVQFSFKRAILEDENSSTLEAEDDAITISNLAQNTAARVQLPRSDVSSQQFITVTVTAEYVTKAEPDLVRQFSMTYEVDTSLPLQFNVRDFFRGKRLFSLFTISTVTEQFLRIKAARLEALEGAENALDPNGLNIRGANPGSRTQVVTPANPANIMFQIESENGSVRDGLRLHVQYRALISEAEALIRRLVDDHTKDTPALHAQQSRLIDALITSLKSDSRWQDAYRVTGCLNIQTPLSDAVGEDTDVLIRLAAALREQSNDSEDLAEWRQVIIPVDIPPMNVLAGVRVSVLSSPSSKEYDYGRPPPLYAGQPISAVLTIETTFHWSNSKFEGRKYRMRFDVEEMVRVWLVSGRKRGDFIAEDGGKYVFPFTLIALHHGELPLPRVSVTPLPMEGELTMGSLAIPSSETYQIHGAEKVLILPRGGRSTFVIGMGGSAYE